MSKDEPVYRLPEFDDLVRFMKGRWPAHADYVRSRRDDIMIELIAASVDLSNFAVLRMLNEPLHNVSYETPHGEVHVTAQSEKALSHFVRKVTKQ